MDDSEPISSDKLAEYTTFLDRSQSNIQLTANYGAIKKSFEKGEINDEQKETLRKLANQLFLKLKK